MKSNLLFATLKRALAYEPYVYEGNPNNPPTEQCGGSCCLTIVELRSANLPEMQLRPPPLIKTLPAGRYTLVTSKNICIPCNMEGKNEILSEIQVSPYGKGSVQTWHQVSQNHSFAVRRVVFSKALDCGKRSPQETVPVEWSGPAGNQNFRCFPGPVPMNNPFDQSETAKQIYTYIEGPVPGLSGERPINMTPSDLTIVRQEIIRLFNTTAVQSEAIGETEDTAQSYDYMTMFLMAGGWIAGGAALAVAAPTSAAAAGLYSCYQAVSAGTGFVVVEEEAQNLTDLLIPDVQQRQKRNK